MTSMHARYIRCMRAVGTILVCGARPAAVPPGAIGSDDAASRLSGREAALAVREEIGNSWLSLSTFPRGIHTPGATAEVECRALSPGKLVCDWSAANAPRGQHADGLAVVAARPGGAEARLYAYFCQGPEGLSCY
jgi:hypothetical protein